MTQTSSQHIIGIIIPNQCSLLTLGALTEPFARANQLLGEDKYQLSYIADKAQQTITISESPLPITVLAQAGIEALADHDCVVVLTEQLPTRAITAKMKKALAAYQQSNNVISCANHQQCLQFILSYLAKYEDNATIRTIRDEFYAYRDDSEQDEDSEFSAELPPRLQKAVSLMENNLEDPISTDMIADLVHVSRRQLERLFKRYLDTMPARYYLQLRLKSAQKLLQTTNHSVVQIGLMCGFSSGPHFSSAYKQYFALTPREERAKRFHANC